MPTSLVPLFPGLPGGPEMIVILLIVVLLFGANKLPKLARSSGQAMGEFKKGREEIEKELQDIRGDEDAPHSDESFDKEDSFDNDDSFGNEGGFEQAGQGQSQQPSQGQPSQRQPNDQQRSQDQNRRSGQNSGGWGASTETGRERSRR